MNLWFNIPFYYLNKLNNNNKNILTFSPHLWFIVIFAQLHVQIQNLNNIQKFAYVLNIWRGIKSCTKYSKMMFL